MNLIKSRLRKRAFVTGGAGFIGSHLSERLLEMGWDVVVFDNLSLGKLDFLEKCFQNKKFCFIKGDLLNKALVQKSLKGCDVVFHLAANSDIMAGTRSTDLDLKQGVLATYNVLESMRQQSVRKIIFASSSAIYGDAPDRPLPETFGPLLPISFYGASKLACEGLLTAFSHNFDFQAWIFRFGNIIGKNGTHGVIYDFIRKLRKNPGSLEILGDGQQAKSYLHVSECVNGLLFGFSCARQPVNIFNLTTRGTTVVNRIAALVIAQMGLRNVRLHYTGGKRGWKGDVPSVRLDPGRLKKCGWAARYSSDDAVRKAAKELEQQL